MLGVLADGEAEGDPESGRTWVESLAHWFAHGIKRILIRISGSDEPEGGEAGEQPDAEAAPSPDDAATAATPDPAENIARRPATGGRAPAPAPKPAPKPMPKPVKPIPAPTTAKPWTTTPPAPAPTPGPTATTAPEPSAKPEASTPSATVYDDEAFDEGPGSNKVHLPVDETNELN